MQIEKISLELLTESLLTLEEGFKTLPEFSATSLNTGKMMQILLHTAERLQNNYPYFHPYYAGQMLKPPHPAAKAAYMLAMWINPNNHALDGGRESSAMEKEAVAEIASMFGWEKHLGHLTSGGTMANMEALWIAGQVNSGKKIIASDQAHYTHARITKVLGLNFTSVGSDRFGRMDIEQLKLELDKGETGTVVATLGTTAIGAVDPLPQILRLQENYKFRIHADCAYGGYFTLIDKLAPETKEAFNTLSLVDSIVIDPHKHGLQPYGCGCILFKNQAVGSYYKHDSPYTYFSSSELHLGEISLECSRAGASAVALWATQKLLPLIKQGEFANSLSECREAALEFYHRLQNDSRFIVPVKPELDIVFWAPKAESATKASILSQEIFDEAAKNNLHLALAELPMKLFNFTDTNFTKDRETVKCLRSVLMKPEHNGWIDNIWAVLSKSVDTVLSR